MIYGSINGQYPDGILQNIADLITWEGGISERFSSGHFNGFIITDNRLINTRNDVSCLEENDGTVVLIDGFVYNKKEISSMLGIHEADLTLPGLVAKAYQKWGVYFADKLNGDFVICIFQKKNGQALLFRDHLGLRPLAVSRIGSATYFATDPMGLCKALFREEKIDHGYLLNHFLWEDYDYTIMPNKKILKLNPGFYFQITPESLVSKPYWFPEKIQKDNNLTFPQVREELGALLTDSIKIRADRHLKAAAHVSGGLDSGIVAAMARKEYSDQSEFYGFSWSPEFDITPDKITHDERLLVDNTCKKNNLLPLYCNFNADDYLAFLSDWRHPSETIYERKIIETAREKGVSLIFSGWGGDEFISIGNRGIDSDLIREFEWGYFLKKYPVIKLKKFLSALLFNALFPSLLRTYSKFKAEKSVYPYIRKALGSNTIPRRERFHFTSRRDVHLQLLKMYHLAARASDWYVHGQRNGIEYRYPLLDKRIVEYMLKVPSRCLVDDGNNRIILKELGKDLLPNEVLLNKSKDDPVKSYFFSAIVKNKEGQFIDELEAFRSNPDLSFVDFNLLEKNLPRISANNNPVDTLGEATIFYYLKTAHEFTKGYYS